MIIIERPIFSMRHSLPLSTKDNTMWKLSFGLLLASVSASISASTPAAWAKLEREATRKCIEASDVRRPRVSNPLIFNDQVGTVAILVSGIFPRSHMKAASVTSLCLYDRHTRTAVIQEAVGWSASRR